MAVWIDSQARAKKQSTEIYTGVNVYKVYKQTVYFQIKYLSL